MKNVIVFGATGNIGAYLCDYLNNCLDKQQFSIYAVGRKKTDFFLKMGITYFQVDVTKKEDFKKITLDNVYAVINLVGILPAYTKTTDLSFYANVNIIGSLNIMEFAKERGVDRILYSQTWADLAGYWGKVYTLCPNLKRKIVFTGDHAFYTISKCTIVDTMEMYKEQFGIKNFVFRLPNIYLYSPRKTYFVNGEEKPISYRLLIDNAKDGKDIELWGKPDSYKDIVYIKDLCQLFYLALICNKDGGLYNVGTGIKTTMKEQIDGIIKTFGPKDNHISIIYRPDKPSFTSFVMDISNAREDLGYKPKYTYLKYLIDYKKEEKLKRFDSLWEE